MKMKKWFSMALALCVCLSMALPVYADEQEDTDARTVIGADLSTEQIEKVYRDFGIERGTVTELTVTNAEERVYLEGKVSEETIGTRSISCVYIKLRGEGEGLSVQVDNVDWCTEAIYTNALITAGIYDANVIVTAPFTVSGTAALTGLYKAYEDITGEALSEEAKDIGTEELVITSELADEIAGISDEEIAELINELKGMLDETQNMTDDEVRAEIRSIADSMDIVLTDEQVDKILSLVRSLEGLSVDELMAKAKSLQETVKNMQKAAEATSTFVTKVQSFFAKVADFFSNLFGGNN